MSNSNVTYQVDARGIATIELNRPDKHNAFDDQMIAELEAAFVRADKDPGARVVVLSSTGKSFSAGADLAWMKRMAAYDYQDNLRDAEALASMLKVLNFLSKPTIAKVQGAAYGGAVGLVSCCDLVIASDAALFSLSEVKLGLIPATISPYVVAALGQRAARRYCLTGERFSAQQAQRLGLVTELVGSQELDQRVTQFAQLLLRNGPEAMSAIKQLVFEVANETIDAALIGKTSESIAQRRASAEGQEGLKAFLEKRTANWIED